MAHIEIHIGNDTVIPLQFPPQLRWVKHHWWQPRRQEVAGYDDQTHFEMPQELSEPYGLDRDWGFRLQGSIQLWVFIPMMGAFAGKTPPLAVGGIFPHLTLPIPLQARGGMAIALIELESVNLMEHEGRMTLFVERIEQRGEET